MIDFSKLIAGVTLDEKNTDTQQIYIQEDSENERERGKAGERKKR